MRLHLRDEAFHLLRMEATRQGRTVDDYAVEVLEKEAVRLWHIERSRPKPPKPKRPVGRPRLDPKIKRFRDLSAALKAVYEQKRKLLGEDFERILGQQYSTLLQAIEKEDLAMLEKFEQEQPWARKW